MHEQVDVAAVPRQLQYALATTKLVVMFELRTVTVHSREGCSTLKSEIEDRLRSLRVRETRANLGKWSRCALTTSWQRRHRLVADLGFVAICLS